MCEALIGIMSRPLGRERPVQEQYPRHPKDAQVIALLEEQLKQLPSSLPFFLNAHYLFFNWAKNKATSIKVIVAQSVIISVNLIGRISHKFDQLNDLLVVTTMHTRPEESNRS